MHPGVSIVGIDRTVSLDIERGILFSGEDLLNFFPFFLGWRRSLGCGSSSREGSLPRKSLYSLTPTTGTVERRFTTNHETSFPAPTRLVNPGPFATIREACEKTYDRNL
jgi:hypothetical protein